MLTQRKTLSTAALAAAMMLAGGAGAQTLQVGPLTYAANGHSYAVYSGPVTWHQARDAAAALGGNLVTIADQGEQDFVTSVMAMYLDGTYGGWIGLTDEAVEGDWRWVTGEPLTYTNWQFNPPQPDGGSGENYVHTLGIDEGRWNDSPPTPFGFNTFLTIVEFEGAPQCACEFDDDAVQVNVFDLLAYLSLWFVQDRRAEFDGDTAQVDVFDLLAYLSCWFPASAGACP